MGVNSLIERVVRRQVFGHACVQRLEDGRVRATEILEQARALDDRLERAEAARTAAEAERDKAIYELERLFHFIPALLIFKTLDGTLLRVNENTARGFGVTPSDMVGKNQTEFWPLEQCERFQSDDADVARTGEGRYGYLEPVQWGGEEHVFRTWKIPIYNGAPEPIGIMLFAINITSHVCDQEIAVLGKD